MCLQLLTALAPAGGGLRGDARVSVVAANQHTVQSSLAHYYLETYLPWVLLANNLQSSTHTQSDFSLYCVVIKI